MKRTDFEFRYIDGLRGENLDAVTEIFVRCDQDFFPPISARDGLVKFQAPVGAGEVRSRIEAYVQELARCEFLTAFARETGEMAGLMAYRKNYMPGVLVSRYEFEPVTAVYINMAVVLPEYRRMGLTRKFYDGLIDRCRDDALKHVFTLRTRANHVGHIALLEQLGFIPAARLMNDRGPGLDTLYFALEV